MTLFVTSCRKYLGRLTLSAFLSTALSSFAAPELEPNNDLSSSQQVALNSDVEGMISNTDDEDWFAANLGEPGVLSVRIDTWDMGTEAIRVSLLDPAGNILGRRSCYYERQCMPVVMSAGTSTAGRHYLAVTSEGYFTPSDYVYGGYRLTPSFSAGNAGYELEPNNRSSASQRVFVGSEIGGTIHNYRDMDWFHISANGPGDLYVNIGFTSDLGGSRGISGIVFSIKDRSGKELANKRCGTNQCRPFSLGADIPSAGDYYIRVSAEYLSDVDGREGEYYFSIEGTLESSGSSETTDTDGDGIGNNADGDDDDDDGDGVPDASDAFPLDANETTDTDGDGIGNNADGDDNGDGVLDTSDDFPLDPTRPGETSGVVTGMVFLQTTSTSQNISLTHVINSSEESQRFTGTLYNSAGESVGGENQPLHVGAISPNGRLILSSETLETVFDIPPWRGPALLEVKGTTGFELMTKLTSPSGLVSNTNCVTRDQVDNIEGSDSPNMSYIRLINIGTTTLSGIRGTIYDGNGEVVGNGSQTLVSSLAPKQQVWINRDDLFDIVDDNWNGEAMLKIESPPATLRLLNLNFINSETFFNFSCYETGQ